MSDRYFPNMAYVAFSRVRTLKGLTIYNFNESKITTSQAQLEYLTNGFKNLRDLPLPRTMIKQTPKSIQNKYDESLSIFYHNIRSLPSNIKFIDRNISYNGCDFGCMAEVHCGDNSNYLNNLISHGYDIKFFPAQPFSKGHYGLLFFANQNSKAKIRLLEQNNLVRNIENLSIGVDFESSKILITFVYISPSIRGKKSILEDLEVIIKESLNYDSFILLGDFNIDYLQKSNSI